MTAILTGGREADLLIATDAGLVQEASRHHARPRQRFLADGSGARNADGLRSLTTRCPRGSARASCLPSCGYRSPARRIDPRRNRAWPGNTPAPRNHRQPPWWLGCFLSGLAVRKKRRRPRRMGLQPRGRQVSVSCLFNWNRLYRNSPERPHRSAEVPVYVAGCWLDESVWTGRQGSVPQGLERPQPS